MRGRVHDALANFRNLRHKNPTAWVPSYSNCEQSPRYAWSELPAIWRIRTRLFESICNLPNSRICGLISWRLADVGGGKYRPICVQVTSAPEGIDKLACRRGLAPPDRGLYVLYWDTSAHSERILKSKHAWYSHILITELVNLSIPSNSMLPTALLDTRPRTVKKKTALCLISR